MTLSVTLLAIGSAAIWISGTEKHMTLIRRIKEYATRVKIQIKSQADTERSDGTHPSVEKSGTSSEATEQSRSAAGPHNASSQAEATPMGRAPGDDNNV